MNYGITKEFILKKYKDGKSTKDIIKEIGCTKSTFYRKLKEFNLNIEELSSKYIFKDKEWLEKQFNMYKTPTKISKETGIPRTSITRYAEKYKIRNVSFNRKKKNEIDENYFETIDTEHKAYWLGFIMADGYIYQKPNKKYEFGIKIKNTDCNLIKKLAKDIKFDINKIQIKESKRNDTITKGCSIRTNNQKFCDNLLKHGIVPQKSGKEFIPNIPKNLLRHFIRGFWDGDGSILFYPERKFKPKTACCCSLSIKIIEQINTNLIENNIHFKITKESTKNNTLYILRCQDYKNICNFINYIYKDSTIFLDRKHETAKKILRYCSK